MKTEYVCDYCGWKHKDKYTVEFHEKNHRYETTQYYNKKPTLGTAVLLATTKDHQDMVPEMALIEYNGKVAWYRFSEFVE